MVVIIIVGKQSRSILWWMEIFAWSLSDVFYALDSKFSELKLWSRFFVGGHNSRRNCQTFVSSIFVANCFFRASIGTRKVVPLCGEIRIRLASVWVIWKVYSCMHHSVAGHRPAEPKEAVNSCWCRRNLAICFCWIYSRQTEPVISYKCHASRKHGMP